MLSFLCMLFLIMYREAFVSTHDMQTLREFVEVAERVHKGLYYAKTTDNLWSQYVISMIQDLPPAKLLAVNVGRQPDSEIWVFDPDVQIDITGSLIKEKDMQCCWSVLAGFLFPIVQR